MLTGRKTQFVKGKLKKSTVSLKTNIELNNSFRLNLKLCQFSPWHILTLFCRKLIYVKILFRHKRYHLMSLLVNDFSHKRRRLLDSKQYPKLSCIFSLISKFLPHASSYRFHVDDPEISKLSHGIHEKGVSTNFA